MKKVIFLILTALVPLACVTTPPSKAPEIDELMERWITGLREENINVLMSTYWPDAELVMVQLEGEEQHLHGHDEIERFQLEGFQQPGSFRDLNFSKPEGEIRGNSATYHIHVEAPGVQLLNRFELIRRDGQWKIVHQILEPLPSEYVEAGEIPVNSEFQAWVDGNRNGVLEPPEFEELKRAIERLVRQPHFVGNPLDEMFDWNGDGYIDGLEQRTAGRIVIDEQLRRLPLLDPDMVQLFDVDENEYLQFWETHFVYSVVVWNHVWPFLADRIDENHDGEMDQLEIDEFVGRVYDLIMRLPLNPEDAAMYRWKGKQALFGWTDLNGDGEIAWEEFHDLGARVTELVDVDELPYPLNSSLADYFDRNRDGSIGELEVETMRKVLVTEQLDLLFDLGVFFGDRPLIEVLDLNRNERFDQSERSLLLELFFSEPGADERRTSTPLEKSIDPNKDGLLESGEHHHFETTVMGALTLAWLQSPEEEPVPAEGWAVRSPLDELADLNGDGFVDQIEDRQMAEGLGRPHPVQTPFDRRIDFNGNGEVETFEIVKARRAGERIEREEEGVYEVRTILDDHLDLNEDGQVDELEIDRVLRFLRGETDVLDHRSKLRRLFDLNDDGKVLEAELVKGIDLYLLPRPVNPEEPFDSKQDRDRDDFVDPGEIGIAAGVSARGDIPTIPERLERMEWEFAQRSERTVEEEQQRQEKFKSEFYKKLGQIQGQKLAVVGITRRTKKIDEETASGVMVFIENAFVNVGELRVVDRENITKIVKEYEFQSSDLTDESTAVEIGKLSGADIIVIGSISYVGEIFYLNIKLISVETAEIIGSSIADALNAKEFYEMCNDAVFKLF
ncbi:MAG: hypothetical protein JSV89_13610 [Spirochaetaceae bacterium]|nr:MAG: hypothetical protein JSV89_13610 [Spirochaetaceae bacterium]